jgi:hypothetical protein
LCFIYNIVSGSGGRVLRVKRSGTRSLKTSGF